MATDKEMAFARLIGNTLGLLIEKGTISFDDATALNRQFTAQLDMLDIKLATEVQAIINRHR